MTTPTNKRKPGTTIENRLFHMGGKRSTTPRNDYSTRPHASMRPSERSYKATSDGVRRQPSVGSPKNQRAEKLNLPFENRRRKGDAGEWVFEHRVGLLVTIVIYLMIAILFVSYRIVIYDNPATVMYVELVPAAELESEKLKDVPKEVEKISSNHYERVMNRSSDENAKRNASLKDDRGTRSEELYEESDRVQRELAEGKQALEDGMNEIADISKRNKTSQNASTSNKSSSDNNKETTKVQGNVTVSYSLTGRTATYLHMPAYRCQDGGKVVVEITVNRSGEVVDAVAMQSSASSNDCITTRAVQSAYASVFNVDAGASNRQKGSITYIFVAQ